MEANTELKEVSSEDVEILHGAASNYLQQLRGRSDPKVRGFIDDEENKAGNLALIELAELHRDGKYDTFYLAEIRNSIFQIMDQKSEILGNISYLPEQFGWEAILSEALSDSELKNETWGLTSRVLDKCVTESVPGGYELEDCFYRAANQQKTIPPDVITQMTDYFLKTQKGGECYGYLHESVFLDVIKRKLSGGDYISWFPMNVKDQMSKDGLASKLTDLLESNPSYYQTICQVPNSLDTVSFIFANDFCLN